jgi:hypothetical protein
VASSDFHLFNTVPAMIRVRPRRVRTAPTELTTPSAPGGAMIDYYLRAALDTTSEPAEGEGRSADAGASRHRPKVIVTVTDAHGDTVVVDSAAPGRQGVNRFVWNLRYAGATRIAFERQQPPDEENPFRVVGGPRVLPGTYTVAVTAAGKTETKTVTVLPDPAVTIDSGLFLAQLKTGLELRNQSSALNEMLNRIAGLQGQLQNVGQALRSSGSDTSAAAPVLREARTLGGKLKALKDSVYNSDLQREAGQDDIHYLRRLQDQMQSISGGSAFAYAQAPTEAFLEEWQELRTQLDAVLARFNTLLGTDVAQFNKVAQDHQAPFLVGGDPIRIRPVPLR